MIYQNCQYLSIKHDLLNQQNREIIINRYVLMIYEYFQFPSIFFLLYGHVELFILYYSLFHALVKVSLMREEIDSLSLKYIKKYI